MPVDAMWGLIERARSEASDPSDASAVAEKLTEALAEQDPAFIAEFGHALQSVMAAAYGWPLWGAAYLIEGGCSDDGFDYFLGWLVTRGRATFEAAVTEPDSLADLDEELDTSGGENIWYVASRAHKRATGAELPGTHVPRPDLGEDWDFDDDAEMSSRYPRLWERFGEN